MLIDQAENLPQGIVFDVCVIGSGPAGLSLAMEISKFDKRVLILEQGDLERAGPSLQDSARGEVDGLLFRRRPKYLNDSRSLMLGGSSNCWQGNCQPLDDDDFEVRPYIKGSGWPISRSDLQPFYERAETFFDFRGLSSLRGFPDWQRRHFPTINFEHKIVLEARPRRIFSALQTQIERLPNLFVLTSSVVMRLSADSTKETIQSVEVRHRDKSLRFRAKTFVLAAGAIENARLLLLSAQDHPLSFGNRFSQVGRHFMEHPQFQLANAVIFPKAPNLGMLSGGAQRTKQESKFHLVFRTSKLFCQRYEIPSVSFYLQKFYFLSDKRPAEFSGTSALASVYSKMRWREKEVLKRVVMVKAEQRPNPDSRVQLSANRRDAFGRPRIKVSWRYAEEDIKAVGLATAAFGLDLGRHAFGRLRLRANNENERLEMLKFSSHPMGTTRMSDSPQSGVVDRNCRVHGTKNLFVAGSSVFTTGGSANPTMTIVALALRLADHLKEQV